MTDSQTVFEFLKGSKEPQSESAISRGTNLTIPKTHDAVMELWESQKLNRVPYGMDFAWETFEAAATRPHRPIGRPRKDGNVMQPTVAQVQHKADLMFQILEAASQREGQRTSDIAFAIGSTSHKIGPTMVALRQSGYLTVESGPNKCPTCHRAITAKVVVITEQGRKMLEFMRK